MRWTKSGEGRTKCLDYRTKRMRMDHGRLLLGQEDQEYMDDVDGVNQVKEEDDDIMELGRGQTCVYIEDD